MSNKLLEELVREKEKKLSDKTNHLKEIEATILVKKEQMATLKKEIREDEKQLETFKKSFEYVKEI